MAPGPARVSENRTHRLVVTCRAVKGRADIPGKPSLRASLVHPLREGEDQGSREAGFARYARTALRRG